jgi:hypothetical protein
MSIVGSEQWMYSSGAAGFYDFPIEQSLRFNDNDSAYLTKTFASDGTKTTWTFSCWLKRGNINTSQEVFVSGLISGTIYYTRLEISTSNKMAFLVYNDALQGWMHSENLLRDVGAWYHLVWVFDTTNGTASDRMRMYINGERVTNFATEIVSTTYPSLNGVSGIMNSSYTHKIGRTEDGQGSGNYLDAYLADVNFIDGQALDPTSFGELKSGIWTPKDTADLTFGTNGFRLQFGDSAAIGDDTSGNTNDWTVNNLVASDVVLDSPTNNFAVMNPLSKAGSGGITFSEGNLKVAVADNGNARSNFVMNSGKWYWEAMVVGGASVATIGIAEDGYYSGNLFDTVSTAKGYIYINDGNKRSSLAGSATAYGASYTTNDIIGVAYDADNGTVTFYKNNATQGTAYTGLSGGHSAYFQGYGGTATWVLNTGADSTFAGATTAGGNADANGYGDFAHPVPSGFLSLCSLNLPTGAIDTLNDETPEDYFNTVLYSGNSTNNTPITVGFQPSMTWIKTRNVARDHRLMDAVRGATAGIYPNLTNAEGGSPLISFDTDGFTLNNTDNYNNSGETYASWNWKAGGSGVSNTDGSITSTVSVGATSQQNWFSVVSWTGTGANATVGHGLNTEPQMIITKARANGSSYWLTYHSGLASPSTSYMALNTSDAVDTGGASVWNSTAPTSSVFSVGTSTWINPNGGDMIAYCFANAENLCRVGKYTGNGSADGVFVYTGHKPKYVMLKRSDSTGGWNIIDAERSPINPNDKRLEAQGSGAEGTNTAYNLDFLSNGFKLRTTNVEWNASGGSYIFLSISEQPFKFANAR